MIFRIVFSAVFVVCLILIGAYLSFFERKVIGYMQARIGPNRVGWHGWLQPVADTIKLLCKELIVPSKAQRCLFIVAPVISMALALIVWAVIPCGAHLVIANINLGALFVLAVTSLSVFGILLGGWSSNSKYALLGAVRAAAQIISYAIPLSFCVIGVTLLAGSLNLQNIIAAQSGGVWHWFCIPLLPLFIIYFICGVAEVNRLPFDIAEAESELVGGFHVEYSGIIFAMFFLAEYVNILLISTLAAIFFLGGWLSPFQGIPYISGLLAFVPGIMWLLLKAVLFVFVFFWIRGTLPRYRYDQIMGFCWKTLLPITIVWVIVESVFIMVLQ